MDFSPERLRERRGGPGTQAGSPPARRTSRPALPERAPLSDPGWIYYFPPPLFPSRSPRTLL